MENGEKREATIYVKRVHIHISLCVYRLQLEGLLRKMLTLVALVGKELGG